jgi:penicillin V acylase-like amidase (Ntn superfamily)
MVGANGSQFTSQEMGRGNGWRIDAENPDPGGRPGQLHLQDYSGNKYQYDFKTGQFTGLSNRMARTMANDPAVQQAINKGLQYLGMGG